MENQNLNKNATVDAVVIAVPRPVLHLIFFFRVGMMQCHSLRVVLVMSYFQTAGKVPETSDRWVQSLGTGTSFVSILLKQTHSYHFLCARKQQDRLGLCMVQRNSQKVVNDLQIPSVLGKKMLEVPSPQQIVI